MIGFLNFEWKNIKIWQNKKNKKEKIRTSVSFTLTWDVRSPPSSHVHMNMEMGATYNKANDSQHPYLHLGMKKWPPSKMQMPVKCNGSRLYCSVQLISAGMWLTLQSPLWENLKESEYLGQMERIDVLCYVARTKLVSAEILGIIGQDLTVYKANWCIYWRLLGPLHTRAKSRDHEIVRAQKKVSKGRPSRHLQSHVV